MLDLVCDLCSKKSPAFNEGERIPNGWVPLSVRSYDSSGKKPSFYVPRHLCIECIVAVIDANKRMDVEDPAPDISGS